MKRGILKFMISSAALMVSTDVFCQEIGAATSIVIDPQLARDDVAGARAEASYRPIPVMIGPLLAQPRLSLVAGYESNVFNQPTAKSAAVLTAMPLLEARTNLSRHSLKLAAAGTLRQFSRYSSENSEEFALGADGRLELAQQQELSGQIAYAHLIEPRSSAASIANAAEPVAYNRLRADLDAKLKLGRVRLTPAFSYQEVRYESVSLTNGGKADQKFRDTRGLQGGVRIDYDFSGFASVFVSGAYARVKSTVATGVRRRDSQNPVALAGISGDLSPLIWGEIAVGYFARDYESAAYKDFKGVTFRADLQWYVTPLMTLRFQADRSFRNSGDSQVAGVLADQFTISAYYDPTRNLRLLASASIERDRYREAGASTWRHSARFQTEWRLNRGLSLGGYASLLRQDVSGPAIVNKFDTLRIGIGITLTP